MSCPICRTRPHTLLCYGLLMGECLPGERTTVVSPRHARRFTRGERAEIRRLFADVDWRQTSDPTPRHANCRATRR